MNYIILLVGVTSLATAQVSTKSQLDGHSESDSAYHIIQVNAKTYGPRVSVLCTISFPPDSSNHSVRWQFSNRTITENAAIVVADPSRYMLEFPHVKSGVTFQTELHINHVVKSDEGSYQCQIEYQLHGKVYKAHEEAFLKVKFYLPPPIYPECSIEPTTALITGDYVTFNCAVGDSNPEVDLQLTLQMQDGSTIDLGHKTKTKRVKSLYNNVTFICHMSSNFFTSSSRSCSVDPVTVQEPGKYTVKVTVVPHDSQSTTISTEQGSSAWSFPSWIIIIGSAGAFILVLTVVISISIALKYSKSNRNRLTITTVGSADPTGTQTPTSLTSPTSDQDGAEQVPMYDAVHEPETVENCSPNRVKSHTYQNAPLPEAPKINANKLPLYANVHGQDVSSLKTGNVQTSSPSQGVESHTYQNATLPEAQKINAEQLHLFDVVPGTENVDKSSPSQGVESHTYQKSTLPEAPKINANQLPLYANVHGQDVTSLKTENVETSSPSPGVESHTYQNATLPGASQINAEQVPLYAVIPETENADKSSPNGVESHTYQNATLPEASKINSEQVLLYANVHGEDVTSLKTENVETNSRSQGVESHTYQNATLPEASKINAEQPPLYAVVNETENVDKSSPLQGVESPEASKINAEQDARDRECGPPFVESPEASKINTVPLYDVMVKMLHH